MGVTLPIRSAAVVRLEAYSAKLIVATRSRLQTVQREASKPMTPPLDRRIVQA
jgi:hypothetical protein